MIQNKWLQKEREEGRKGDKQRKISAMSIARAHFAKLNIVFVPRNGSWKCHIKGQKVSCHMQLAAMNSQNWGQGTSWYICFLVELTFSVPTCIKDPHWAVSFGGRDGDLGCSFFFFLACSAWMGLCIFLSTRIFRHFGQIGLFHPGFCADVLALAAELVNPLSPWCLREEKELATKCPQ